MVSCGGARGGRAAVGRRGWGVGGAGLLVGTPRNAKRFDCGRPLQHLFSEALEARGATALPFTPGGGQEDLQGGRCLPVMGHTQPTPAVAGAAASMGTPYGGRAYSMDVKVSGRDSLPPGTMPSVSKRQRKAPLAASSPYTERSMLPK